MQGRVDIFTDGSASTKDGSGGWAFVATKRPGHKVEGFSSQQYHADDIVMRKASGGKGSTTSNAMELDAMYQALTWLRGKVYHGHDDPTVSLYTDSKYARSAVTQWAWNWRKNGWVNSTGQPVANRQRIEYTLLRLLQLRNEHGVSVKIKWVKGHAGYYYNEMADQMAGEARRKTL